MHGKVQSPLNLRATLRYNERKVATGAAECIGAGNFLKAADQLTWEDKWRRFSDRIALNRIAQRNTVHISLNFSPKDRLDTQDLIRISREYMDRIGFGRQPYLVYRHNDTGHMHLHIVSTSIRADGSWIDLNFLGKRVSTPVSRELTEKYGLIGPQPLPAQTQTPPRALEYAKSPELPAISAVVRHVLDNFRFRSLEEMNAVLRLYNVRAVTGKPGSRLNRYHGLLYEILDHKGKGRGLPVKASAIPFKPTLKNLAAKFEQHLTPDPSILSRIRRTLKPLVTHPPQDPVQAADTLRLGQLALSEQGSDIYIVDLADRVVVIARELGPGITPSSLRAILHTNAPALDHSLTQQQKHHSRRL